MPRKKTFTVEATLDGALELFSERGYHGTTMEAIAKHLKLSRSAVYFTFRSKPALFVQLLQWYRGAGRAPGLSELSGAGTPRAALVRVFVAAGCGEERPRHARSLLIAAALWLKHREPEIARLVEETFLDIEGRFRAAVERGKGAGEIAAHVDAVTVARGAAESLLQPVCDHRPRCCRRATASRAAASRGAIAPRLARWPPAPLALDVQQQRKARAVPIRAEPLGGCRYCEQ